MHKSILLGCIIGKMTSIWVLFLLSADWLFSNIDRITALWQASLGSHDKRGWWDEQATAEGTWAVPEGTVQKSSDSLVPFRKSKKNTSHEIFWTSNEIRNWKTLGYTYQGKRIVSRASGLNDLVSFDIDLDATDLISLNTFYGQFYSWMDNAAPVPALVRQFYPFDISSVEALTGKPAPERPALPRAHPSRTPTTPSPDTVKPDYSHLEGLIEDGKLRQWNANIRVQK